MITAMVRAKLAATSAVTALVSTRIYVDMLPEPATLPAISVHPVSRIPDPEVGKGWTARVQVSCWSDPLKSAGVRSPAEVESVAAAVTAALHKARMNMSPERWTVGSVSYDITSRKVTGGTRLIEDPTGWYHVPVDVLISYYEV
jgi:hypothetical protein